MHLTQFVRHCRDHCFPSHVGGAPSADPGLHFRLPLCHLEQLYFPLGDQLVCLGVR